MHYYKVKLPGEPVFNAMLLKTFYSKGVFYYIVSKVSKYCHRLNACNVSFRISENDIKNGIVKIKMITK